MASAPVVRTPRELRHALAILLFAAGLPACAALEERVIRATVPAGASAPQIEVTAYRPAGPGPFPVVVLSHGSPRDAAARTAMGRVRLQSEAHRFTELGFAVLVPTRRGYGSSGGRWAEAYGSCSDPDYYAAGLETARDLRAAVDAVRDEPWVDTKRVVLAGQSAGGFGSVAASSQAFPGLVAVVNFAGGRGSKGPDEVCDESRLVEAMERYGATARVPALWIYSANDRFFGPALARRMHEGFVRAGGDAQFVEAPSTGLDGHGYFARSGHDWSPRVAAFLKRVGATP